MSREISTECEKRGPVEGESYFSFSKERTGERLEKIPDELLDEH